MSKPTPKWQERLALLAEAPDSVVVVDAKRKILGVNTALCRLTGYTSEQLLSMTVADVDVNNSPAEIGDRITRMFVNGNEGFTSRWRRADGGIIDVNISAMPNSDESIVTAFVRDITQQEKLRSKLERSRAFLGFLSRANALIARSEDPTIMYHQLCRLATDVDEHIVLAWIGLVDSNSGKVMVATQAGPVQGYLDALHVSIDPGCPEGRGPTGTAIRENRLIIVNRFASDPITAPWHAKARQQHIGASASVPFSLQGKVHGALMLYSDEEDTFDDELVQLIGELGTSVTHALDYHHNRTERTQAEAKLVHQAERGKALIRFAEKAAVFDENELLAYGIEEAERLTRSEMGFLHFVNDDQETLTLSTWTSHALTQCQAVHDDHYPISQAGVWADAFRLRQPVVINDYTASALPHKLPEGHAELRRLISVPAIDDGKVRIIAGVGNKREPYSADDVNFVLLLITDLWRIVQRTRAERALREALVKVEKNLTQQRELNRKLEEAQNQLLQSEKMASIGQLAAGVAHELNNPIGFVSSNLGTLDGYLKNIFEIAEVCEQILNRCAHEDDIARLNALKQEKDFDFLRQDVVQLINESREGLNRVSKIVQDLKDFSRIGEPDWQWADIHAGLESTLNIVWNELKYKCTVVKHYAENLPQIYCLPFQLNQVFMNLLINAAQAIEAKGEITISTAQFGADAIRISIADSGKGIPAENLERIFEPFFTTKKIGQGTGLGLSIAWGIIGKHHGKIDVQSTEGRGTTFTITLPVKPPADAAAS